MCNRWWSAYSLCAYQVNLATGNKKHFFFTILDKVFEEHFPCVIRNRKKERKDLISQSHDHVNQFQIPIQIQTCSWAPPAPRFPRAALVCTSPPPPIPAVLPASRSVLQPTETHKHRERERERESEEEEGEGRDHLYLATGDVDGEASDVVDGPGLGEGFGGRVGAEGGNVAHVEDAVDEEGHGAVHEREGDEARETPRVAPHLALPLPLPSPSLSLGLGLGFCDRRGDLRRGVGGEGRSGGRRRRRGSRRSESEIKF